MGVGSGGRPLRGEDRRLGTASPASVTAPKMWNRFRRLNVSFRQTVMLSTGATTVVAVGCLSPQKAHMAPSGSSLASATGRTPEWGSEQVHTMRADWACIGANKASEDRLVVAEGGGGVICAVFDGHYGPRASEFCRQNAGSYFAKAYKAARGSAVYVDRFFELMETGWTDYARVLVRRGDWSASLEGACALIAHVTPGRLQVGNLGDCRAILIQERGGALQARQLTQEHNASRPEERDRILKEHKGEPEAVQYVAKSGSWYVKGTLQVTRAIGDLFLKDLWFSAALPDHVKPYVGGALKTPPYVSVNPDIVQVELTSSDKVLIIASDGLWDELTNDECVAALEGLIRSRSKGHAAMPPAGPGPGAALGPLPAGPDGTPTWRVRPELLKQLEEEEDNAAGKLLWRALNQNPVSNRYGLEYVLSLEPGSARRQIHDDTSILVLWL